MSRERPILFSTPLVKALLDGRKTETRRVMKPQPSEHGDNYCHGPRIIGGKRCSVLQRVVLDPCDKSETIWDAQYWMDNPRRVGPCPCGEPGDLLWVRETWAPMCRYADPRCECDEHYTEFKADTGNWSPGDWPTELRDDPDRPRWRPSIHMPKAAARIWLRVTEVRVERVQDITADGARAEGCPDVPVDGAEQASIDALARWWFLEAWDSIYSKRGLGWDVNPWVWVVRFDVVSTTGRQDVTP